MAGAKILGVNQKNARNFLFFLESRGVYDFHVLQPYQLADLFMEYQVDYIKANYDKAKTGAYTMSAAEAQDPFSMCAVATMAEYAESENDIEAMYCIGEALRVSVEGGANVYRAISMSVKCKEHMQMVDEAREDAELYNKAVSVFRSGSTEGRLRQCEEHAPFHNIFEMFEKLAAGRAEVSKMTSNLSKLMRQDPDALAKKNLQEKMLDEIQAMIDDELSRIQAQQEMEKFREMLKSKENLLEQEQRYEKGEGLVSNNFVMDGTPLYEVILEYEENPLVLGLAEVHETGTTQEIDGGDLMDD